MIIPHDTKRHNPEMLKYAKSLVAAGLSVIPIRDDGSKAPVIQWKCYQATLPTDTTLRTWFRRQCYGLAIVSGRISGGLEIIDFDAPELFAPWAALVEELSSGLLQRLPVVRTPTDGLHVYYRCETTTGNLKLAQRIGSDGRPETAIETRGEGGYVLAPGCPLACHPAGKPYERITGDLTDVPRIMPGERAILLNAARSFNTLFSSQSGQSGLAERAERRRPSHQWTRPSDDYTMRACWNDILSPHGFVPVRQWKGATLWRRPGKRRGWSVVTGGTDPGYLWTYSTNAAPFEVGIAYSKFTAYTLLNHNGDFKAAARAITRDVRTHRGLQSITTQAAPRLRTIAAKEVRPWR